MNTKNDEWEGSPRNTKRATGQKDSLLLCKCPGSGDDRAEEW